MPESSQTNANIKKMKKLVSSDSLYLFGSRKNKEKDKYATETISKELNNLQRQEEIVAFKEKETQDKVLAIDELVSHTDTLIKKDISAKATITKNLLKHRETDKNNRQVTNNERIIKKLIKKHEISRLFSKKLKVLNGFKIVFILDDSGSMNENLEDSPLNRGKYKATRWDELQEFMRISIEIANVLNEDGCDVYFLNRPMEKNVRKFDELKPRFKSKPSGLTPITAILSKVLKNNMPNSLSEKKLLTIIVTDGEPTNTEGRVDIKSFKECLISRPTNVFTTILACTDEDKSMEYLNNWDKYIQRLDVVDDFRNEKHEILRSQGSYFRFSYGDYVVKSLVGSIDPSIDNLDENKLMCCRIL